MQVLVTGASGHVGAALVRALLLRGDRVRALVRQDVRAIEGLDVERASGDVTQEESLARAMKDVEVVFHAAARVSLEAELDPQTAATNVEGTKHVLRTARAAGVRRVVHFSTAHALVDNTTLRAEGDGQPYERTKASAEREVQRAVLAGQDVVVVSPCAVIGPFDHKPSHMGRVLLLLGRGLLPATVRGGQSWVDVRDIAQSAMAAATQGAAGSRYVLAGHWLPMPEFAKRASLAAGARAPFFSVSAGVAKAFAPLAERAFRMVGSEPLFSRTSMDALEHRPRPLDPTATRDLGHAPRALDETLSDTFRWYEGQGLLRKRELV